MVTLNIVPVDDPPYTVDDDGAIHIVLKDTANTYADGSNPQKDFIVIPKEQTMQGLNKALILAKEEAIDYFRKEAERIAYRHLVITGMNHVTIPEVIFSGDPARYEKVEKIGVNKDEIIIADSIDVRIISADICEVSAAVLGKDQDRSQARNVKITWNRNEGLDSCRDKLITAYNNIISTPEDAIRSQLIQGIGTVVPE